MLESISEYVCYHAEWAHLLFFGLFLLAGLNIPISEDVMLATAAVLAATTVPENTTKLFAWCFAGALISDMEAYWVGRILGKRVLSYGWISTESMQKVVGFYDRFGAVALFFGRFVPFGVRNCLFLTSGMTKMPIGRFLLWDGPACFLSNLVVFYSAYQIGKSGDDLTRFFHAWYSVILIVFAAVLFGAVLLYVVFNRKARA